MIDKVQCFVLDLEGIQNKMAKIIMKSSFPNCPSSLFDILWNWIAQTLQFHRLPFIIVPCNIIFLLNIIAMTVSFIIRFDQFDFIFLMIKIFYCGFWKKVLKITKCLEV